MVKWVVHRLRLVVFFFTFGASTAYAAAPAASIPELKDLNVVLIAVDTLGARHLSVYNSNLTHTPNLAKLAEQSIVFDRMQAAAPWTKPSMASVFTGKLPSRHGVRSMTQVLSESEVTLAEFLKSKGFMTRGIISHTLISKRHGYSQGFDNYNIVPFKGNIHRVVSSELVSDEALQYLEARKKDDHFFLFLHYFDPHYDYFHHEKFNLTGWYKGKLEPFIPFRKLRAGIEKYTQDDIKYLVDLYREEIAFTDFHIGRVLEKLRSLPSDRKTLLVFLADHGEEFVEHGGVGHTRSLYDELIHIPLMVSLPGSIVPARIKEPVSHIDIYPTLRSLDPSLTEDEGMDGISLLPTLEGSPPPSRLLISEVDYRSSGIRASAIAATSGSWKLIHDKLTDGWELYNRDIDPLETKKVPAAECKDFTALRNRILEFKSNVQPQTKKVQEIEQSKEDLKELKSLGYI